MKRVAIVAGVAAVATIALSLTAAARVSDDLRPIDQETVRKFGKVFTDLAAKFDKPQIKIEGDAEKAVGLHAPGKAGLMIVPQKDLKEGEELSKLFKSEKGAPIGYLFLYHISPAFDGKTADWSRLREVKMNDDGGNEHVVRVVLLAVKQTGEDKFRLHGYGHEEKPIIDVPFAMGTGPGDLPIAVEIKETDEGTQQGKLVITLFGKFQSSFRAGYKAE